MLTKKYITLFTRSKNDLNRDLYCNLDCNLDPDPEDVSIYETFIVQYNKVHHLFIVHSLLHRDPHNIWIKII